MAIFTRFGNEVEIISHAVYPTHEEVIIRRSSDGNLKCVMLYDLSADGGIDEIQRAIKAIDSK